MIKIGKEKVLLLHQLMAEATGGDVGIRDEALLESAIENAYATFDGAELYPTKEEKAARLGFSLIANHAFVDGNKRIGIYVMLSFLELNGIRIEAENDEVAALGLAAADGSELDIGSAPELEQSHYQCNMAAFIQLGRWFDELRKQGVWDNTRIILVSDHSYSLNLLGFDLADRYPEASESSWINGEPWTITSAYEPLLMVKDFNATGFSTDTAFMTNADTPVLAFGGTVDHPVNPFTGNPIVSDPKYAGELHLMETDWHFVNNDGFTFSDPRFITFRNQDITNPDNWYIEDWEQED